MSAGNPVHAQAVRAATVVAAANELGLQIPHVSGFRAQAASAALSLDARITLLERMRRAIFAAAEKIATVLETGTPQGGMNVADAAKLAYSPQAMRALGLIDSINEAPPDLALHVLMSGNLFNDAGSTGERQVVEVSATVIDNGLSTQPGAELTIADPSAPAQASAPQAEASTASPAQ